MTAVLVVFAVGVVAGRLRSTPSGAATTLDWFVIRLALPALVLDQVRDLDIGRESLVPIAAAWAQVALVAVAVVAVARWRSWPRRTTGAVLLCATLGNTSFLGFPATEALLGTEHLPTAIVYDQLGSFLALSTWGAWVAARYGTGPSRRTTATLARLITFPPFTALCVAGVLRATGTAPEALDPLYETCALLGATVTPLAIVSVGLRVRVPRVAELVGPAGVGLVLKMVAAPAAVLAVMALVDASGDPWAATALQTAAPPMVTASILATETGLDERVATAMASIGLLVAFVTLPFVGSLVA